eukprot:SAG22_NODE_19456_length_274_cov_1.754286_1_plen_70_part_01
MSANERNVSSSLFPLIKGYLPSASLSSALAAPASPIARPLRDPHARSAPLFPPPQLAIVEELCCGIAVEL